MDMDCREHTPYNQQRNAHFCCALTCNFRIAHLRQGKKIPFGEEDEFGVSPDGPEAKGRKFS